MEFCQALLGIRPEALDAVDIGSAISRVSVMVYSNVLITLDKKGVIASELVGIGSASWSDMLFDNLG